MYFRKGAQGFTLIELVMVVLTISILGSFAVPSFLDLRTDAKNASVKNSVGVLRSCIQTAATAISLREASTAPRYPTYSEMQLNMLVNTEGHPNLTAKNICDISTGYPANRWAVGNPFSYVPVLIPTAYAAGGGSGPDSPRWIHDCEALTKAGLLSGALEDKGWCYKASTGEIWANSDRNGAGPGATENTY